MSYKDGLLYEACQKRKQVKKHFFHQKHHFHSSPLEMLHLHLFEPTRTTSISSKR